ncbi:MAG: BrnT family toxin [Gammaproteobacteria bacterium]|nr:BrnT family toxin [Gammaproteobacteria bacterium]
MRWTWDSGKNRTNKRVHGLRFETARLVFDDPHAVSRRDPYPDESRWQTTGMVGNVVLLVVHTQPEPGPESGEEIGRVISARKATKHERRAYEEGDY